MNHFLVALVAHLVAAALLALLSRAAKIVAQRARPSEAKRRKVFLQDVYLGRFLDFYLGYARPFFGASVAFILLLNLIGVALIRQTQGILFLDTTGTALAAFTLGPWWAATIGILTNLLGSLLTGPTTHYHLFGIVNATLGIAWGYYAIFFRSHVTQLDMRNIRKLLRTILLLSVVGTVVSTPVASYLLVFPLGVLNPHQEDKHTGDDVQVTIYRELVGESTLSPAQRYGVFTLCQVPFNLADKALSVLVALALLHLLFPLAKVFDSVTPTVNFIKSSSGSHIAFVVMYAGTYFSMYGSLMGPLLLIPIGMCLLSYVAMFLFVPAQLGPYYAIAEYFSEFRVSTEESKARRRVVWTVGGVVLALAAYTAMIVLASHVMGVSSEQTASMLRSVLTIIIVLLLFVIAAANLLFLTWDLRKSEHSLKRKIDESKHRAGLNVKR
jgi:hypothetical protein